MKLILLGIGLLMGGMALPFLMVVQILTPSFALNFLAYGVSLVGLGLGISVAIHHGSFRFRERD